MGTCVYCNTVVPFNTTSCVVCEAPMPNQNQPQASIKLADKIVCTLCGTANPANLTLCLTCDVQLPSATQQKVSDFHILFHFDCLILIKFYQSRRKMAFRNIVGKETALIFLQCFFRNHHLNHI